jgi:hypothetical protein
MDGQWMGPGKYRPASGEHYEKATGDTEWVPCSDRDQFGRLFRSYQEFKAYKRQLRAKDRLLK